MARLIDADALIAKLKKQYGDDLGWQCTVNMSDVGMMIEDADTVDAAMVVRCKNCKHCDILNGKHIYAVCKRTHYPFMQFGVDTREHFCSFGERKE